MLRLQLSEDCVTAQSGQVNHVTMFWLVFILLNKYCLEHVRTHAHTHIWTHSNEPPPTKTHQTRHFYSSCIYFICSFSIHLWIQSISASHSAADDCVCFKNQRSFTTLCDDLKMKAWLFGQRPHLQTSLVYRELVGWNLNHPLSTK